MKKLNLVALLPMKNNSERVKNKNFKEFCGKPLFYWMLEKLLIIDEINKIVINTDAIFKLEKYSLINNPKIILRERRKDLCGDHISMNKIIADDVDNIDSKYFFMTHTTNPILTINTIKKSILTFFKAEKSNFDSLFSVNKIQTRFYDQRGIAINHDPKNLIRTQDLPVWYEENSNIYIFSKKSFKQNNSRIGLKPKMFITGLNESIDIDTPDEWDDAEIRYSLMQNRI